MGEVCVGERFGRWVVIDTANVKDKKKVLCRCDCGTSREVLVSNLTQGLSLSCGCARAERTRFNGVTHGQSKTRLYSVWGGMIQRCYNTNNRAYKNYGGRGIKMCPEWRNDFMAFRKWALESGYDGDAPKGQCTLDRIDVNGDYCPENCRWVNMKTQSNNTRCNIEYVYKGETLTLTELAEKCGIPMKTLRMRILRGWTVEDAAELPLGESPEYIEHHVNTRPVNLIDGDGNILRTFPSIEAAVAETGCPSFGIGNVCRGWQKSTKGLMFEYADEHGDNSKPKPVPIKPVRHDGHLIRVDMLSKSGDYLRTFQSINDAVAYLGKRTGTAIGQCCKGRSKSAYGYLWRYADVQGEPSQHGCQSGTPDS